MKRIYFSALAALMLGATSCNDILDVAPTGQYSDNAIWANKNIADYYIMASYQMFNDYSNFQSLEYHFYDAYSDLFKSTVWDAGNQIYNKMFILGDRLLKNSASAFDSWGGAYNRIRRANLLLNQLEEYGPALNDPEWMEVREAEIRFCRALNYFHIARVYGGFVLRTDKSGFNGKTDDGAYPEDCNRARLSEAESYKYILDELQWAADVLPEKWVGDTQDGRATKGMVYGFISRIALYAQQWQLAVDAADKCEQLGQYDLVSDYAQLFKSGKDAENRKEVIYALYYKTDLKTHSFDGLMRSPGDAEKNGLSKTAQIVPTAELADSYEFQDGTAFDWSTWKNVRDASGKKITDPYTYREPRFQATILYDGAQWEGRTIDCYVGQTASVPDGVDHWVEFKNQMSTQGYTCTGYYIRKYLMEGYNEYYVKASTNTEIILRFAEVLLNKAEALAQLNQFDEAAKPLNRVRARVGLPARSANNLDDFMALVRKERICELAGEGLRYWDLIRWKLAQEVIDGQAFHGVNIVRRSTGTKTYTTVEVDGGATRMFPERYYRLSLPADELTNNKLCVDNPGW